MRDEGKGVILRKVTLELSQMKTGNKIRYIQRMGVFVEKQNKQIFLSFLVVIFVPLFFVYFACLPYALTYDCYYQTALPVLLLKCLLHFADCFPEDISGLIERCWRRVRKSEKDR